MKIAFPVVASKSGSDRYYDILVEGLKARKIRAEKINLTYLNEFFPPTNRKLINTLQQFDLIHTNADYATLFLAAGKPIVSTIHHDVFDQNYQKFTTLQQKLYHFILLKGRIQRSIQHAHATICVSNSTRSSVAKTYHIIKTVKNKTYTIYNGIDCEKYSAIAPVNEKCLRHLLFIGKLSKRKGADILLPLMQELGPDYKLTCITRSDPKNFTADNIEIFSNVSDSTLLKHLTKAGVILAPSRLEGFGYAVAEAMAAARPVICSGVSSLPELIDEGVGGYLCEPDDMSCFTERIQKVSNDLQLSISMGTYNQKKVNSTFSKTRQLDQYIDLYQQVLSK